MYASVCLVFSFSHRRLFLFHHLSLIRRIFDSLLGTVDIFNLWVVHDWYSQKTPRSKTTQRKRSDRPIHFPIYAFIQFENLHKNRLALAFGSVCSSTYTFRRNRSTWKNMLAMCGMARAKWSLPSIFSGNSFMDNEQKMKTNMWYWWNQAEGCPKMKFSIVRGRLVFLFVSISRRDRYIAWNMNATHTASG